MATDLRLYQRGLGAAAGRTIPAEEFQPQVIYQAAPATPWRGYATAGALVLALGLGTLLGRAEAPPAETPAPPQAAETSVEQLPPQAIAAPTVPVPVPVPTQVANYSPPTPVVTPQAPAPVRPASRPAAIRPSLGVNSYPTYHAPPRPAATPLAPEITEEEIPPSEPWRTRLGPPPRWRQR